MEQVLVKVKYTGICVSDIPRVNGNACHFYPNVLGHEFSGEVVEVGKKVTLYAPGDRVVGEPHNKACGKCYQCRNGHIQNCSDKRSIGWGIDGAFTNYLVMPEHLLHKVPEKNQLICKGIVLIMSHLQATKTYIQFLVLEA